jgi:hypothetical protein
MSDDLVVLSKLAPYDPNTLAPIRVFVTGQSGTGKTTVAWQRYLSRHTHRIIWDVTGEWTYGWGPSKTLPDGVASSGAELLDVMEQCGELDAWTISIEADGSQDQFSDVIAALCPADLQKSPIARMGGAIMLLDECDTIAASGPAPRPVRTLFRRSRHLGLSLVSATQRPPAVSREVTAQSSHCLAFHLMEPRDRDYLADFLRLLPAQSQKWAEWTLRHRHGYLYWEQQADLRVLIAGDSATPQSPPNQ